MANSRLENYLNSMEGRLKMFPVEERNQQIEELRQHLESITVAQIASGRQISDAETDAIRQFGGPRGLAWKPQAARWKRFLPQADGLWLATIYASALTVCQTFDLLPFHRWIWPLFNHPGTRLHGSKTWDMLGPVLGNPAEITLGAFFGFAVATAAPRSAIRGVLSGNGLYVCALVFGLQSQGMQMLPYTNEHLISWFAPQVIGMLGGAALVSATRRHWFRRSS